MTVPIAAKPWDFSQVLNLINTLDAKSPVNAIPQRADVHGLSTIGWGSLPNDSSLSPSERNATGGVKLGDFSRVWELLGTPQDVPAPKSLNKHGTATTDKPTSPTLQQRVPAKTDYTSDGAVYLTPKKPSSKSIQWRDESNGGHLTDVAPDTAAEEAERLTKKQRKKKNRQERRRLAAEGQKGTSDFESEAEEKPAQRASSQSTSVSVEPAAAQGKYNLRPRDLFGNAMTTWTTTKLDTTPVKVPKAPESFFATRERSRSPSKNQKSRSSAALPSTPIRHNSQPLPKPDKPPATVGNENRKKPWPAVSPPQAQASPLLPSSVQPPRHGGMLATSRPKPAGVGQPVHDTPTKRNPHMITPKTVRTGEDRDWALLLKLISDFYEDRGNLIKPANLANHSNNPKGIHVFVDASNIFIGFMDQLKRARDIPQHFHVPRVEPSFGALALLMERRRPVAKRVLVGSKPHLTAFDSAREIGYECNILDKVLKARELTERQIYFKEQERKMQAKKYGRQPDRYRSGSTSGGDSGGDSTGPVFAREAMVEQGVDEILHLKMMESIVDTEEPSTMVLATGDAAQAEYSQGFMKMTQRALKAGWKVELVSWSKNISKAYTSNAFRREWGEKFRIVELDDYAEELLDM